MDLNMSWEWCTAVCIMCVHSPRYRSNLPLSCAVLDNGKLDNFFFYQRKGFKQISSTVPFLIMSVLARSICEKRLRWSSHKTVD